MKFKAPASNTANCNCRLDGKKLADLYIDQCSTNLTLVAHNGFPEEGILFISHDNHFYLDSVMKNRGEVLPVTMDANVVVHELLQIFFHYK